MTKQYISATVSTQGRPHTDFTKVTLTRHSNIDVEFPTNKRGCYITNLAVLPGNLLLLTDRDNQSVKLVDPTSGQLLDQLQLHSTPWGLCLLPGDRAAVTIPDKSTIQTIAVTHKKLALQNGIQIEGQCSAIDYINDYFVVAFSNPAQVALIDTKGKIYKIRISKGFLRKTLFKYPDHICVTTETTGKVIYVSDNGTKTITRLSEELQVLQSFTDPALVNPHGLASVGGGQLLVVNWGDLSTLSVLDVTTGQFTSLLGREEELSYTGCVAVSHTLGTLFVDDWYSCIRQYTFK